jgi:hypothetical protein
MRQPFQHLLERDALFFADHCRRYGRGLRTA